METFLLWKEQAALPTQATTNWTGTLGRTQKVKKQLTTTSGLRADMSGEDVAECIELSTDKMEGGREEEEELEEEDEELSSLSTCCSECTVMNSTCCTMAGWVRQEEEE